VFQRELGRVSVADFNASFRGEVYGESGVDADWFAEHVGRNGIDLARSPRWLVDGALGGMALLAFRGARAWAGAFGVVPELRGRGYARRFLADALALAAEGGAATLELEVLERNAAAIELYERGGFATIGELIVWKRAPLSIVAGDAAGVFAAGDADGVFVSGRDGGGQVTWETARRFDSAEVARLARHPPTCWQREPPGVAAASPIEAVLVRASDAPDAVSASGGIDTPAAYAFVRRTAARTALLDAGARDTASAAALLAALDLRLPETEPMLLNEPPHGPLHDALAAHPGWSEFTRQRRMIARL
jgi:GNAT superfamily N-acetyltransferase